MQQFRCDGDAWLLSNRLQQTQGNQNAKSTIDSLEMLNNFVKSCLYLRRFEGVLNFV